MLRNSHANQHYRIMSERFRGHHTWQGFGRPPCAHHFCSSARDNPERVYTTQTIAASLLAPQMPTTERLLVHLSSVRYRRYSRVCKDNDNRLVAPFINKPLPLLRAATVQQSKQLHPAMEVKTASSLNSSVLNPAVFITPSPLRYAHHVSLNASAFSSNP